MKQEKGLSLCVVFFFFPFSAPGIELRGSRLLGKHSATGPNPQPFHSVLNQNCVL